MGGKTAGTCRRRTVRLIAVAGLLAVPPGEGLRAQDERAAEHEVTFETGAAHDSNPFLAPVESYYDQNAMQVVTPSRVSGYYTPLRLDGRLNTRRTYVNYELKGELYPHVETRNAENFGLRVEPGFKFELGGNRDRTLRMGPFAGQHKEIFFDRDTGLAGEFGGVDVSDRYTYRSFGGELELELELSRAVELELGGLVERRDYENIEGVSSFDHDIVEAETRLSVRLGRPVSVYVGYAHRTRSYADREAKDLDGESDDTNSKLAYDYGTAELGLRFRAGQRSRTTLAWQHTERTDTFVGYNDYTQDRIKFRSSLRGRRWSIRLMAGYRERQFARAFIFDNPTSPLDGSANPLKSYETLEYGTEIEFGWDHFRVILALDRKDQESADPRFSYDRLRSTVGARWVY